MLFFFFKQKTAYEMRISDWSSDVCSSDLGIKQIFAILVTNARAADRAHERHARNGKRSRSGDHRHDIGFRLTIVGKNLRDHIDFVIETFWEQRADGTVDPAAGQRFLRSEEHTSELQSLMRISYAVFCWKKTKITQHTDQLNQITTSTL